MTKTGSIAESLAALVTFAAVSLAGTGVVSAASPSKCIVYARDYARAMVAPTASGLVPARPLQDIQDAAYARCVKSARVPAIPNVTDTPETDIGAAAPSDAAPVQYVPSFDEVFGVTHPRLYRPPFDEEFGTTTKTPPAEPVKAPAAVPDVTPPPAAVPAVTPPAVVVPDATPPAAASAYVEPPPTRVPSRSARAISDSLAAKPAPTRTRVAERAPAACSATLQHFWRGTMSVSVSSGC